MAKDKKVKEPKSRPAIDEIPKPEDGDSRFARALGSGDFHTRDKGLKALTLWLQRQQTISESAIKKIWRGIYFCFWHSDKAHVQEDLALRLAAIFPQLNDEVSFEYFREFLDVMRQEWVKIDRLRLDKFMMLVRKFLAQLFQSMAERKWDKQYVAKYTKMLHKTAFVEKDALAVVGFSLHVADIYMSELIRSSAAAACPVPSSAATALLRPFVAVVGASQQPALIARIRTSVFESLADELCKPSDGEPLQAIDAHALAETLLAAGGKEGVRHKNRSALYDLSQRFEKVDKKRKRDVAGAAEAAGGVPGAELNDAPSAKRQKVAGAATPLSEKRKKKAKVGRIVLVESPVGAAAEEAGAAAPTAGAASSKDGAGNRNGAEREAVSTESPVLVTPASSKKRRASRSSTKEANGAQEVPDSAQAAPLEAPGQADIPPAKTSAKKAKKAKLSPTPQPALVEATAPPKRKSLPGKAEKVKAAKGKGELRVPASAPPAVRGAAAGVEAAQIDLMPATFVKPLVAAGQSTMRMTRATLTPPINGVSSGEQAALASAISAVSSAKRSIRFNLKKNTVHQIGKPLPPADIRTPPHAKPNGSALKKVSSLPPAQADPKIARKLSFSKSPRKKAIDFV